MNTEHFRSSTISEIVNQLPGAIPVFERFRIDYCCNAATSFTDACLQALADEGEVINALKSPPPAATGAVRAQDWSLDLLTNYIVQNHHQYVKRTLPELQALSEKVFAKHGPNHPELSEILEQVKTLNKDLPTHMYHEEHVLFPAINALVKESSRLIPSAESLVHTMSNLTPVVVTLETEHDLAGHCLHRIRQASNNFSLPADACNAFAILYQRLQEFETDLHMHVYLENNLLFPKALSLQARQQEKPVYVN